MLATNLTAINWEKLEEFEDFSLAYSAIMANYNAGKAANDETAVTDAKACRARLAAVVDERWGNKSLTAVVLWEYIQSRQRGNALLDLSRIDSRPEKIAELMRIFWTQKISWFTFSATYSGAVNEAMALQNAGCRLAGLVEIYSHYHTFCEYEPYEKTPAFLFEVR